jgi:hypothetical protein
LKIEAEAALIGAERTIFAEAKSEAPSSWQKNLSHRNCKGISFPALDRQRRECNPLARIGVAGALADTLWTGRRPMIRLAGQRRERPRKAAREWYR